MKSIHTSAIINGVRSKVDGSLGLSLSTPELSTQEKALFMELQGINLEITITPTEEVNVEVQKIDKDVNQKTASQRLRNTLFVWWKQEGEKENFEVFYKTNMERFINHIKDKLEE